MTDFVDLKIKDLTISEAKEILLKLREIERRDPGRFFFAQILGLEHKSLREAEEILKDVFPGRLGTLLGVKI